MTGREGSVIHPHGLLSPRKRNGTQAVPYGFAGMCLRLGRVEWKGGRFLQFSLEVYKMRGGEGGIWYTMVLMSQDNIKQRSPGALHLIVQIPPSYSAKEK